VGTHFILISPMLALVEAFYCPSCRDPQYYYQYSRSVWVEVVVCVCITLGRVNVMRVP